MIKSNIYFLSQLYKFVAIYLRVRKVYLIMANKIHMKLVYYNKSNK